MQQPQVAVVEAEQPKKRYKSLLHLFLICINLSMGTFYAGNGLASLSSVEFDTIIEIYGITWDRSFAQGLLTGAMPIGASFGAIFTPHLLSMFSRRNCLFAINAFAVCVGLMVYIENDVVFLIIRLLNGFCVGMYSSVVPVMIKEIAPVQVSGTLGAMVQFFVAFGIFFTYLFQYIVSVIVGKDNPILIWKIVAALTLFTIAIQVITLLLIFPYETPKYLLLNDREQEARQLLAVIYHEQFIEEVFCQKQLDLGKQFMMKRQKKQDDQKKQKAQNQARGNQVIPIDTSNKKMELTQMDLMNNNQLVKKDQIAETMENGQNNNKASLNGNKLPPIIPVNSKQVTPARTQAQMKQDAQDAQDIHDDNAQKTDSPLSIFVALHLTFLKQLTGLNGVVAYGGQITKQAIPQIKEFFNIILNFEQVLGALAVTILLTRVGRKTILQVGTFINICMCFLVAVGFFIRPNNNDAGTIMICVGLVIYMGNLTTTLAPVVWIFAAELVQPWVAPYAILFNWLGAAFVMFLFPIVTNVLPDQNPAGLFIFFGLYCLIAFIFDHFYVIETMGKTEKVIREEYKQKAFCCKAD